MKELFKAIDLDISEAHCASWRPPKMLNKIGNMISGHELLAVFLQSMNKYDVCVLCVFVLALINWMDRFQHLMKDYNAPCKFSSMLLDAFLDLSQF